jgi:hypothetical protein
MSKQYPEHEKLKAIKHQSQIIGEFIEWMGHQGLTVCELAEGKYDSHYYPTTKRLPTQLLAEFFEIDENRLEKEKQQMLDEQRAINQRAGIA